jgi:hypothetical protein
MLEQVRHWTKPTQSGIFFVWHQNKIMDAGMSMPLLVSSMPMPSYGSDLRKKDEVLCQYERHQQYARQEIGQGVQSLEEIH